MTYPSADLSPDLSVGSWSSHAVWSAMSELPRRTHMERLLQTCDFSVDVALLGWADLGTSVLVAPLYAMEVLTRLFVLRNAAEVTAFIAEHPGVLPLAMEAGLELPEHFPTARFDLVLETDPEFGDQELVIVVVSNLTPQTALTQMDGFDDSCGLGIVQRANGFLSISMEFE